MGAYDCDCTENLAYEDRNKRATMQCRDCNFYARYVVLKKNVCAFSREEKLPDDVCDQYKGDGHGNAQR